MAWVGGSTYSPTTSRQLVDKFRIVRELELPHAMRLKPVGAPDALNRTDRDARDLCHQRAGPVRRLAGRIIERQGGIGSPPCIWVEPKVRVSGTLVFKLAVADNPWAEVLAEMVQNVLKSTV